MKLAYPAFAVAKANAKGKCCERRRRSRAQCLSACTGVVDCHRDPVIYRVICRLRTPFFRRRKTPFAAEACDLQISVIGQLFELVLTEIIIHE